MMSSRWMYYISSLPTLAFGVKSWWIMIAAFLGLPIKRPFVVALRNGLRFEARTGLDVWVIKESCLDRDYERESVPIQDGWVVIDIGAGLGDFAIHAARQTPKGRVYAYEPAPNSFHLLQRNIIRNHTPNVEIFPWAVNGTGESMILDTGNGDPSLYRTTNIISEQRIGIVKVTGITLNQIFESLQLTRCDFLKIDCEGGEYEMLFQASDATLHKFRHVCLEYHEGVTMFTRHDLVHFFEQKGFVVRHTPNPVHQETGFLYAYHTD